MCANKLIKLSVLSDWNSLEEFLLSFSYISRSFLKKNMDKRWRVKKLRAKEEIELPLKIVNNDMIAPFSGNSPFRILGESQKFLAIYKPIHTHCYPLHYEDSETAINWLRESRPELLDINKESMDRGLLYRLDYGTSGVLLYAKQESVLLNMRKGFNQQTEKIYWAIIRGKPQHYQATVKNLLESYGPQGKQMKVVEAGGQEAHLDYELLDYLENEDLSLLQVRLKTGLRHQIRVQLAHLGHPILGDDQYGGEESDRLYLHALRYTIDSECFEMIPQDSLFQMFLRLNR